MDYRGSIFVLALTAVILHMTASQDLNGCGVTKGCFRLPAACTESDCMAYVTWENMPDGQTRFSMKGQRSAGLGWVGFGLRPSATTSGMSPAEVYACTSNSEVRRSENVNPYDSVSRTIPNGVLTTESASSDNNVINCVFTRQPKLEGNSTVYDISGDNQYYILLAIGSTINGDGSIQGNRHTDRIAGTQLVKLQGDVAAPTAAPTMPQPQGPELEGCGTTKGCFKRPENCGGDDCMAYVTWQNDQDGQTRFTLRAQASGWVAVGLRPADITSGMSPADVYACTSNSEVRRSENVKPLNSASRSIPDGAVTTVSASFENNVIRCVFTRKAKVEGDSKFYDISGDNEYYILLAIGSTINGDGSIENNRHTNRWPSGSATALSKFGPLGGAVPLPKVHGSLMVIAWMGLASIGITLARYFKPMWPNSKLLGEKVWFTIHRSCMVTCFLCFAAAFVVIFLHVRGFVQTSDAKVVAHAILGIVSTFLGIVNPIMAIFRPHPGTPNRPYFNWAHWGVGTAASMIAWANILLGTYKAESGSILNGIPTFVFFVVVAFCIFHAVMWIMLDIVQCRTESQGSQSNKQQTPPDANANSSNKVDAEVKSEHSGRSDDIPMNGTDSNEQLDNTNSGPPPGSTMKKLLLFCYIIGVVVCVVAVIVGIALAGN